MHENQSRYSQSVNLGRSVEFLPCRDADSNNPKSGPDPIASDFSLSACFPTVKALFCLESRGVHGTDSTG